MALSTHSRSEETMICHISFAIVQITGKTLDLRLFNGLRHPRFSAALRGSGDA